VAKVANGQEVSRLFATASGIPEVMDLRCGLFIAALADAASAIIDNLPPQIDVIPASAVCITTAGIAGHEWLRVKNVRNHYRGEISPSE